MSLKLAKTRGVGLPTVKSPMQTGQRDVDLSLSAFASQLAVLRAACGIVLSPLDSIAAALKAAADGDRVLLLPGTYVTSDSITIDKSVTIIGYGARIEFGGAATLSVTANRVTLCGLSLVSVDQAADWLSVSGDNAMLRDLFVDSAATRAVSITANFCGVQGCAFAGSRPAGGADVYFYDGATYGIVCGTMWNQSAGSFSLDYRAIDNTSQAANGPAAVINVR